MIKILTNKKYKSITDEIQISRDGLKKCEENFSKYIDKDQEKPQLINDKLIELLQCKKASKDVIFNKIEEIYRINRGGKK